MKTVGGVLLGAGGSKRMGDKKLLREVGGRSILEISIENLLGSKLCHLCVVIPGWDDEFNNLVGRIKDVRLSFMRLAKPGFMSDSLKAGWKLLLSNVECDGIMISLADMPLIDEQIVDRMIDEYCYSTALACVASYNGQWGHPVILARSLEQDVMNLTGDKGAKKILETVSLKEVNIQDDRILFDVDCEDDFTELVRRLGSIGCK